MYKSSVIFTIRYKQNEVLYFSIYGAKTKAVFDALKYMGAMKDVVKILV